MSSKNKNHSSLFAKQIKHSPKAHRLCTALNMAGLVIDIPTADVVIAVLEKLEEMGGNFDLRTACEITSTKQLEYEALDKEHKKERKSKK